MKNQGTKPNTQAFSQNKKHVRPENKDDLDSRVNEEQDFKGDDSTNNRKILQSEKKSVGKKDQDQQKP